MKCGNAMRVAIDKAVAKQYGDKPPTLFEARFQKEIKTSEREKLTALFDKRLTYDGFSITDSPVYRGEGSLTIFKEWKFWPERQFRFDRAWPGHKLAVEIEGGLWRRGGGAHSHPNNIMRDIEKYNGAVLLGWRVLRFSDYHLKSPYVVECVREALKGGKP